MKDNIKDKITEKMLRGYAMVIKDLPGCVMIPPPIHFDPKIIDATRKCTLICDLIPRFEPGRKNKRKQTLWDKIKRIVRKLL